MSVEHSFKYKVCLVIGGASGIGRQVVIQLAELGAIVIIADRNQSDGQALSARLQKHGHDATFKQVEMLDVPQVESLFEDLETEYKHIHYVFNVAGSFMAGEIRDTPLSDWHYIVEENVFAVMNGTHYAYQLMLKQRSGHIVNVASSAGLFPVPIFSLYGSSKYALVGLSHALRLEAMDLGINVSVVCPIIINTPLYDTAIYHKLNKKKFLKSRRFVQKPETAARHILEGVSRNQTTIHTSLLSRLGWASAALAPWLFDYLCIRTVRAYRKHLRDTSRP